jgi:hypothetical protein
VKSIIFALKSVKTSSANCKKNKDFAPGSYEWSLPNVSKTAVECLVRNTAVHGSADDSSDALLKKIKKNFPGLDARQII